LFGDGPTGGGVYLWKDRESAERLYTDEWRKALKERLGAEPEILYFDTPVLVDNLTQEVIGSDVGKSSSLQASGPAKNCPGPARAAEIERVTAIVECSIYRSATPSGSQPKAAARPRAAFGLVCQGHWQSRLSGYSTLR
jgi:hypothetical protein